MFGIFLDIETNGLNTQRHKIIEIAYKIVNVLTGEIAESFETIIFQSFESWQLSDPNSLNINGFSWDEVKRGMAQKTAAQAIRNSFERWKIKRGKAVFICQNPSFDRGFFNQLIDSDVQEKLNWPYHWLDLASMYWAYAMKKGSQYPWETGISKNKIAKVFELPFEQIPHKAMNGVNHLLLCYHTIIGFPKGVIS